MKSGNSKKNKQTVEWNKESVYNSEYYLNTNRILRASVNESSQPPEASYFFAFVLTLLVCSLKQPANIFQSSWFQKSFEKFFSQTYHFKNTCDCDPFQFVLLEFED